MRSFGYPKTKQCSASNYSYVDRSFVPCEYPTSFIPKFDQLLLSYRVAHMATDFSAIYKLSCSRRHAHAVASLKRRQQTPPLSFREILYKKAYLYKRNGGTLRPSISVNPYSSARSPTRNTPPVLFIICGSLANAVTARPT